MIKNITKEEAIGMLHDFWSLLSDEERAILSAQMAITVYEKNSIIQAENERPTHMYCLLSGMVKIYRKGVGKRSQILRVLRPVQFFGYRAFFARENYITNAEAFEASVVCAIPLVVLKDIVENNHGVALFFIRSLSKDLGISDRRSVSLTQNHIRGRLAETLLFLKDNYGLEDDGATLNIRLSREDLAGLSDMTTANAIRTLSIFAYEKLIALDGRVIKIHEIDKLRRLAQIG